MADLRRSAAIAMAVAMAGTALGCETLPGTRTQQGAALGGLAGGAAGAAIGRDGNTAAGVLLGTAAGAVAGGLVGRWLDRQQRELDAIPDATVTTRDDRLLVRFPGDVFFERGSSALSVDASDRIDALARTLVRQPESRVIVRGHTDASGVASHNQRLSDERADAVRDALVAQGVSRARVEAVGFGSQFPVATNATDAGRRQNRRVEIEIVPDAEQIRDRAAGEAEGASSRRGGGS